MAITIADWATSGYPPYDPHEFDLKLEKEYEMVKSDFRKFFWKHKYKTYSKVYEKYETNNLSADDLKGLRDFFCEKFNRVIHRMIWNIYPDNIPIVEIIVRPYMI